MLLADRELVVNYLGPKSIIWMLTQVTIFTPVYFWDMHASFNMFSVLGNWTINFINMVCMTFSLPNSPILSYVIALSLSMFQPTQTLQFFLVLKNWHWCSFSIKFFIWLMLTYSLDFRIQCCFFWEVSESSSHCSSLQSSIRFSSLFSLMLFFFLTSTNDSF